MSTSLRTADIISGLFCFGFGGAMMSQALKIQNILDEPLHGLDGPKKELARGIIDAFCEREGKTLIYVTHYENELPACIDRRLVLPRRG